MGGGSSLASGLDSALQFWWGWQEVHRSGLGIRAMQENVAWSWWAVPRLKQNWSHGLTWDRAVQCRTGVCPETASLHPCLGMGGYLGPCTWRVVLCVLEVKATDEDAPIGGPSLLQQLQSYLCKEEWINAPARERLMLLAAHGEYLDSILAGISFHGKTVLGTISLHETCWKFLSSLPLAPCTADLWSHFLFTNKTLSANPKDK